VTFASNPATKKWPVVQLAEVAERCLGKMLDAKKNKGRMLPYLANPNVRWFDVDTSALKLMPFEPHEDERYGLQKGDIVICEGGEAGRAAIWDGRLPDVKFQKAIHRVRPGPRLDSRYFVHQLMADYQSGRLADYYTGATIKHLTGQDLARYRFPLPPLSEQRRIAAILDQVDTLRAKRREALALLDELQRGIFIEMFGDPAQNPKGWPLKMLGSIASKFSDGPFGSNLKSEHYVEDGIRVVRLQNIGVGKFIDDDKAFVSEEHYATIRKHECRPGDVLVGTMGDPNLRACLLPQEIPLAINKADCVQIRANAAVANPYFVCELLNHPSTELLAQELKRGQTRVRISMGSLRGLNVPVPPVALQNSFACRATELEKLRALHLAALDETSRLFQSLQNRAFRGEV